VESKDEEKKLDENVHVYKVPKKMSVSNLREADSTDASLNKMKNQLLGDNTDKLFDKDNPGSVLFDSLIILPTGRKEIVLEEKDLSGEKVAFVLQEGCEYCTQINFKVQREIVMCLKAINIFKRKGITVNTESQVVGSYAPGKAYSKKFDLQIAPSGFLGRGTYGCTTILRDDDTSHYTFGYKFKIAKGWE